MSMKIFWTLIWAAAGVTAQQAQSTVGVVTKIDLAEKALGLKTDAGQEFLVALQPSVSFRRVAPGETNLANAATSKLEDIAVGDRVLARGRVENQIVSATLVVLMSQSDIAKRQAADRADWEKRGVTGLVTSVAADSITVNSRTLAGSSQVVISAGANAVVRKYAPDSVKFSDARVAKWSDIKVGDQVRARGEKSADGAKVAAEEIVAGTFKTFAGVVQSIDAQAGEIRVNDLATKKPVMVKINAASTAHKLPPPLAQAIAIRVHPEWAAQLSAEKGGGFGGGRGGADLQQMIDRSPAVTLAGLKQGDAVVVSSTVGAAADKVTAITLLAGVEPILTKPGTQEMSLGSWNLDVGGGFGAP